MCIMLVCISKISRASNNRAFTLQEKCSPRPSSRPRSSGCGAWSTCTTSSARSTSASGSKSPARFFQRTAFFGTGLIWLIPKIFVLGDKESSVAQRLHLPTCTCRVFRSFDSEIFSSRALIAVCHDDWTRCLCTSCLVSSNNLTG